MKLTIQQLIYSLGNPDAGDAGAFNRFTSNALPLKTSMRMKQIIRAVSDAVNDYHEARIDACKRIGKLDPETGNYTFDTPESAEQFNDEFHQLLASEIEFPGDRIRISQLLSSTVISPGDLIALEWLIDDGTAAEPVAKPHNGLRAVETVDTPADEEIALELDPDDAVPDNEQVAAAVA